MTFLEQPVSHKKYGAGRVKSYDQGALTIYFDAWGAHTFAYPAAFKKDLRALDPEFDRAVKQDLRDKNQ